MVTKFSELRIVKEEIKKIIRKEIIYRTHILFAITTK